MMKDLANKIATLSPEQRRLLAQKLKSKGKNENYFPLSFAQQRLWFLNQLKPDSIAYNIPATVRLKGTLDVSILKDSLKEIIRRHEILRTTFSANNGEPIQIVSSEIKFDFSLEDLRDLDQNTRKDEVLLKISDENTKPFNLATGPLFKIRLYRIEEDEHILLLAMHHIISDGWSIGIIIRELSQTYEAFVAGRSVPLPELPIQYADFAHWQRKWLKGEVLDRQLNYWKKQLGEPLPSVLEIPTDHPRPAVRKYLGAHEYIILGKEILVGIKKLASKTGATNFIILLTALQTLFYRYTSQTDVAIGTPIANRNRSEIEPLIGFFVNTLVLRANLSGNPHFQEVIERVKKVAYEAFTNQDIPFEMLIEELQPERDMSHTPLFQVMFVYQNKPIKVFSVDGLKIEPIEFESGVTKFDLTFGATEMSDGLFLSFEYDAELFERSTIQRMLGHLRTLLESAIKNPAQKIRELPILPEREKTLLLKWKQCVKVSPVEDTFQEKFEEQVVKNPDTPAVTFENSTLTYAELNERANQLAHFLQKKGVGPDVIVGMYIDRSIEMIVSILGILKAGGAYLPIDPTYPEERIKFILSDANVPILITQQAFKDKTSLLDCETIYLDSDWSEISKESGENTITQTLPENLAYVIYTSGSTGNPKGVMIQHLSIMNLWFALNEVVYKNKNQKTLRISLNAPIQFDASVQQLVMLLSGHRLYIIPKDVRMNSEAFLKFIQEYKVDVLDCVPSQLRLLISLGLLSNSYIPPIILPGGEAIDNKLWKELAEFTKSDFFNLYGPTECTVDSTICLIGEEDTRPNIGRPLPNVDVHILDSQHRILPIGIPGELCIGGISVSRGYLNRPDLTAEKFIPNPYTNEPGSRLYRTGDFVRFLPNGNIEFLGRIDHQVKVRGYRIELGEIEKTLESYPAVDNVVVVTRKDRSGDTRLVAYVVLKEGFNLDTGDVRTFLKNRLPDYMIPSAIVSLESFPLMPNGKIDRKALPAPDQSAIDISARYIPPRTPTEELLVDLWAQILGLEKVGAEDNFFELGGHSLLATQLFSRIRDAFKIELPLKVLFEKPTIADLARQIDRARLPDNGFDPQPIEVIPRDSNIELPLSFAQQRLWFFDQLEPGSSLYNIPTAIRLNGSLDLDAFKQSVNEIIKRHEILRTAFLTIEGKPKLHIEKKLVIDIPTIDLTTLERAEREKNILQLIQEEATRPFNLSQVLLLRCILIKINDLEHIVVFTMHHIISDAWSSGVLVREIAKLYNAFSKGLPSVLKELSIQYADFAYWQRNWLRGKILEKQLDFWKQVIGETPPVLELPTDKPRPSFQTNHGAHLVFQLPPEVSDAIRELSQREGVTLFMTLLAAFQTLLYRYTHQDDFCIGTPIANRTRSEIEDLIGFFANTLVLKADLRGEPTFIELLKRVKDITLSAYTHQDVPFEKLVDIFQDERNTRYTPLFQVMFVLQNTPKQKIKLPGLSITPVEVDTNISTFDMTLIMEEVDGQLVGGIEYNTDLFFRSTMERFIRHFEILLYKVSQNPNEKIDAVEIISDEERNLLKEWNSTETKLPHGCVHHFIEKRAQSSPDAPALLFSDKIVNYAELNARANKLAHYLINKHVKPDDLIGIAIPRSPEMIIGLLGILKSGAAYLPLDPNYPQERLEYVLRDANIKWLVTTSHIAQKMPVAKQKCICIDSDWHEISSKADTDPKTYVNRENLAYVIYTSGSTGKPKGVLITHHSVVNHNQTILKRFDISPRDRVLQFFSINFDAAVEEVFPTLMGGGTLVLREEQAVPSIAELLLLLKKYNITVLDLPTAYWHEWAYELSLIDDNIPDSLRLVIVGGEQASLERFVSWHRKVGDRVVWANTYGPTEGTIIASIFEPDVNSSNPESWLTLPIGKPIQNVQLYTLDSKLQQTPLGVPGELCIGGVGVARGYLNRSDLTAEKFIPDPFSNVSGSRLYRTGDMAKYLENGDIEFLGRVDDQVKIRGFRIEPGEIESVLRQQTAVREAVVVQQMGQKNKSLIAYIVRQENLELAEEELRTILKKYLPDYMIPSVFVFVEQITRTPSGKVDKKALPKVQAVSTGTDSNSYVEPTNAIEKKLTEIWQKVLGLERISVTDNFFERGGDSILSIQVIAKANQAGIMINPRQLFENPTIAGLAKVAGFGPVIKAEQGLVTGQVPLTPIQQWFFEQNFADINHWNQSVIFQIDEHLEPDALKRAIKKVLEHHDVLRLRFHLENGEWKQFIKPPDGNIPFVVYDLTDSESKDKSREIVRISAELQNSLNIEKGPILQIALFKPGQSIPDRLLILIHHLAVDAISWRILLEDIQAAYNLLLQKRSAELPTKTTSFKYWAEKLRELANQDSTRNELDFWQQQIAASGNIVPIDFAENLESNTEDSTDHVICALDEQETTKLLKQVPSVYHTQINDILLTGLAVAFNKWCGKKSIVVELEGHGREGLFDDVDVSRTIGWFTTIYPVAITLRNPSNPGKALQDVKEQLRRIPGKGIGFGLLRYLNQNRKVRDKLRLSYKPKISFNYLGQFDQLLQGAQKFRPAPESAGPDHSPKAQRSYLLELTGQVSSGRLQIRLAFSKNIHRRESIQSLAEYYIDALRSIIKHCQKPEAGGFTPSDFPLAKLNQKKLDRVLEKINKTKGIKQYEY